MEASCRTRTVLVTGATGFVGRRLVTQHLARGDDVRAITRRPQMLPDGVKPCIADLSTATPQELQGFLRGVDVLYHCAGELRNEQLMESLHVDGTSALLTAARGVVGEWIQLSSVGVYGPERRAVVTENTTLRPVGLYETTKARADALVETWSAQSGTRALILRPSIVIGANMPSPWLHGMLTAVERGVFAFIGRCGASANYVPVDEVAAAMLLAARTPGYGLDVFNLSQWMSMEDFVAHAARLLQVPCPSQRLPEPLARAIAATLGRLPGFPLTRSRVDALSSFARYPAERIATVIGYQPLVSVVDTLAEIVNQRRVVST